MTQHDLLLSFNLHLGHVSSPPFKVRHGHMTKFGSVGCRWNLLVTLWGLAIDKPTSRPLFFPFAIVEWRVFRCPGGGRRQSMMEMVGIRVPEWLCRAEHALHSWFPHMELDCERFFSDSLMNFVYLIKPLKVEGCRLQELDYIQYYI